MHKNVKRKSWDGGFFRCLSFFIQGSVFPKSGGAPEL